LTESEEQTVCREQQLAHLHSNTLCLNLTPKQELRLKLKESSYRLRDGGGQLVNGQRSFACFERTDSIEVCSKRITT
jgi:hypothetical protein